MSPVPPTFIYWVFSLLDVSVKEIPPFISVLCCNICLCGNVSIDYSLKTGVDFHAVFHQNVLVFVGFLTN